MMTPKTAVLIHVVRYLPAVTPARGSAVTEPAVHAIGKYRVQERIASGDLADIFKACLEGIGGFQRNFAIKRIQKDNPAREAYAGFVEEEARAAGLLSHGNIVQLLDLGQEDDALFIAMEFVDGWDLADLITMLREKALVLPVPHAVYLVSEVLKGLEHAHQRETPVVHGDVRPGNIMVGRRGEVKLTDFGVARASTKARAAHPELTPYSSAYVAPEQLEGEASPASDQFSMAVILFELLTGQHPFRGETEEETRSNLASSTFVSAGESLPSDLVDVVRKGMSPDVGGRFEGVSAFKDALDTFFVAQGFVFTQETLAAFVMELCADPEASTDDDEVEVEPEPVLEAVLEASEEDSEPAVADLFGDDEADADVFEDADEPTALPGALSGGPDGDSDADAPAEDGASEGPVLTFKDDIGDSKTVVNPTARRALQRTSEWSEDKATVVNPKLANRLRELKDRGDWSGDDKTRVRAGRSASAGTPSSPATSSLSLQVVLGIVLLVMGSLLGAGGLVIAQNQGVAPAARLSVLADEEVEVSVDGEAMEGAAALTPGEHTVEIRSGAGRAYSFELDLTAGEHRIMTVDIPADDAE